MKDLALVSSDRRSNVILDDGRQSRFVSDIGHPAWQLRVPNSGVSTDDFVIGHSKVDQSIKASKVEVTPRALDRVPFATKKRKESAPDLLRMKFWLNFAR